MTTTNIELLTTMKDQLLESRRKVAMQMERTRRDLAISVGSQQLEGTTANHPADEASDVISAEIDTGFVRDLEIELREIDDALERIDRGAYGICLDCGQPIDPARLRALPAATHCLACEKRHEAQGPAAG